MNEATSDFSDVILSGGTGRSGTTIIGKLLSRHSQVGLSRPAEIKMLTAGNGLLDLYLGRRAGRFKKLLFTDRLHLERFRYRLFNDWWERPPKFGEAAGLFQGIDLGELKEFYRSLGLDWKRDKKSAPGNFLRSFVESQKRTSGKAMWIDTTPINLYRSEDLGRFLPGARFIHMVRDGRDVISSVLREPWGPTNYDEGLVWYRRRMTRILRNTNSLGSRVKTVSLEALAIEKRDQTLAEILDFLGLTEEAKLRDYFETEVIPSRVQQGRWRAEVPDEENFSENYFKLVAELKAIDPEVPLASS